MNDWATETLREVPFWRDDMTPEEYEVERTYFIEHWDDYTKGKYTPLWKQNQSEAILMKVKYIGQSDVSLTNGKIYKVVSIENGWYRIVDDTEEDYLFSPYEFVATDI